MRLNPELFALLLLCLALTAFGVWALSRLAFVLLAAPPLEGRYAGLGRGVSGYLGYTAFPLLVQVHTARGAYSFTTNNTLSFFFAAEKRAARWSQRRLGRPVRVWLHPSRPGVAFCSLRLLPVVCASFTAFVLGLIPSICLLRALLSPFGL